MRDLDATRLLKAIERHPHRHLTALWCFIPLGRKQSARVVAAHLSTKYRLLWGWAGPSRHRHREEQYGFGAAEVLPVAQQNASTLAQRVEDLGKTSCLWGAQPPGDWHSWPLGALAWPFEPKSVVQAPFQPGDAALRLFRLLVVTRADGETGALWRARVPAGIAQWVRAGRSKPPLQRVLEEAEQLAHRARALRRLRDIERRATELRTQPISASRARVRPGALRQWNESGFCRRVQRCIAACQSGSVQKIVVARAKAVPAPLSKDFSATRIFDLLQQRHQHGRCFFVALSNGRAFVGASPETLWQQRGQSVFTHALAGTARNAPGAGARLLASSKDQHEHALVAQHIAATLERAGVAFTRPRRARLVQAGALLHLETPFLARASRQNHLRFVLRHLHPTPALSGMPVRKARAYLAQQEAWRGLYGGAIGWVSMVDTHLAVAIRSALVSAQHAYMFAGAGIVATSDARLEVQETNAKLSGMRQILRDSLTRKA